MHAPSEDARVASTEPAGTRLGHRPSLDGLRGAAVLLVLAGHLLERSSWRPRSASLGVNVFLVLSGFLITTLLLEEHHDHGRVRLPRFFARRALRLLPAMALVVAATGLYAAWHGSPAAPVHYPALYVANVAMAAGRDLGALSHTWSLSLEEQFYVVWPLVLLLALRRGRWLAAGVAVAGAAASLLATVAVFLDDRITDAYARAAFGPDTRSYGLFVGCALALLLPEALRLGRLARAATPLALAAIGVAALTTSSVGDGPSLALVLPAATAATALLIVRLMDGAPTLDRALSWRPLAACGRISYGLYLWHLPIREVVADALTDVPLWGQAIAVVVASFAVSMASYRLLEQPFLRLKRRFSPGAADAPSVPRPRLAVPAPSTR